MNGKHLVLSSFWLKIIGFVTMTFDHVGLFLGALYANGSLGGNIAFAFRCVGRIALPIFIFLLAQALRKSKDPKKYLFRLFVMWAGFFVTGLIVFIVARFGYSVALFDDMAGSIPAHAFNDLLYVGAFLYFLNHKKKAFKWLSLVPFLLMAASYVFDVLGNYGWNDAYLYFPAFLRADYHFFALLLGIGFYYAKPLAGKMADKALLYEEGADADILRRRLALENAFYLAVTLLSALIMVALSFIDSALDTMRFSTIGSFSIVSGLLFLLYSHQLGYNRKWFRVFSYLFYPVHLIIIAVIFVLISL